MASLHDIVTIIRDIVIVVFGVLGIGAFALFIYLLIVIFRKVSPILDAAKGTMSDIRGTSTFVSEALVNPIIKVVSFVQGARKALAFLTRFSRKKEGKRSD